MPAVAARDLATFILLLVAGFVATTATNAGIALALTPRSPVDLDDGGSDLATPDAGPPPPPPNPFPAAQQATLVTCTLLAAAVHLILLRSDPVSLNLALLGAMLSSFSLASTLCSPAVKLWLHPFVSTSLCTLGACAALGGASGLGWRGALTSFAGAGGAGHLITKLTGPCVLSFSFQLYAYRAQLRRRFVQIIGTAISGSLVGMITSAAAARAAGVAPVLRLALISRNTLSALSMEICRMLGVHPPALGLLAAFVSGLLAFPFGKAVLDALGVTDPPARGLALAGTAHGGGMLALADEKEAFPFAALMMNLSGACAVILVSIPPVRRLLLWIALGP